jgi:hypothetical protein
MRLEIRDINSNRVDLGNGVYEKIFSDDPVTHTTYIDFMTPFITLNSGSSAAGSGMTQVLIPDISGYMHFVRPFKLYSSLNNLPNKVLIDTVNKVYESLNSSASATTLEYSFDVNTGLFSSLVNDSPLNFYTDIYSAVCSNPNYGYCKINNNCKNQSNVDTCGLTLVEGDGVSEVSRAEVRRTAKDAPFSNIGDYNGTLPGTTPSK